VDWFRSTLAVLLLILFLPLVHAQTPDHIISNSANWADVYSTTLYGNLQGIGNNFLTSTRHSTLLLYSIPTSRSYVQVITSSDRPFIVGYEDILRSRNYDDAEELIFDNVNLELAKLLPDIHRFIVLDDSYGYNALSAAPYAAAAKYFVLFADELNVDDISDFLSERGVDDLILFGQVDREVREELDQFNPEIVNMGDRFDNNIEMTKRYMNIKNTKQTILTNGEFIEGGLMSGADPVLFIGRTNVPDKVREFIQGSDIDVGILIGNELIGAATFIRRQIGISVFVKFAQGSRAPSGAVAQVEDLDRFPMPRFAMNLSIESVVYNKATGRLEVTYSNNADIATYLKGTITITTPEETVVIGDDDPIFIDGNTIKTITYEVDIPEGDATASIFTIYGEAPQSLENQLEAELEIEFVEVNDRSDITIVGIYYDKKTGKFYIEIENTGEVKAYIDAEILDLIINEEKVNIGGDEILELGPGETGILEISIELDDEDILDNPTIKIKARYGERKLALIKEARGEFEFQEKRGDIVTYILIIVVIILIFLIFWKRRKKKDEKKTDHHSQKSEHHSKQN